MLRQAWIGEATCIQKNDRLSSPVLESAWQRYAEFYTSAATAINRYKKYREVAIVLAMIAVVFAVFSSDISRQVPDAFKSLLSIPLILILIINFILLAMSLRSQQQETGGALRSAAEEIKKKYICTVPFCNGMKNGTNGSANV
jgi:predicted Na+-dependent transporter